MSTHFARHQQNASHQVILKMAAYLESLTTVYQHSSHFFPSERTQRTKAVTKRTFPSATTVQLLSHE
jgi:hypothetical protein